MAGAGAALLAARLAAFDELLAVGLAAGGVLLGWLGLLPCLDLGDELLELALDAVELGE